MKSTQFFVVDGYIEFHMYLIWEMWKRIYGVYFVFIKYKPWTQSILPWYKQNWFYRSKIHVFMESNLLIPIPFLMPKVNFKSA